MIELSNDLDLPDNARALNKPSGVDEFLHISFQYDNESMKQLIRLFLRPSSRNKDQFLITGEPL